MGHRSKRPVKRRVCPVCGVERYDFEGEKPSTCPYRALHQRTGLGEPNPSG